MQKLKKKKKIYQRKTVFYDQYISWALGVIKNCIRQT